MARNRLLLSLISGHDRIIGQKEYNGPDLSPDANSPCKSAPVPHGLVGDYHQKSSGRKCYGLSAKWSDTGSNLVLLNI